MAKKTPKQLDTSLGSVQKYPCDCMDPGNPDAVCWIVRHPALKPSVSYETERGAKVRLGQLRAADQRSP